uniref:Alkylated DNA repair protein AlkB homologue 8 N-terminal domain-containing protein n=1 Tax=Knipowitschia caucasica TaxID=637954 RepID=A0AAV2MA59_KNICA
MYFLRQLRKAKLPAQMLVQFYTAIIESILTSSVTVWFAGATVRDKQRLQRIVRSAEEVIGRSLPSLQDLCLVGFSRVASALGRRGDGDGGEGWGWVAGLRSLCGDKSQVLCCYCEGCSRQLPPVERSVSKRLKLYPLNQGPHRRLPCPCQPLTAPHTSSQLWVQDGLRCKARSDRCSLTHLVFVALVVMVAVDEANGTGRDRSAEETGRDKPGRDKPGLLPVLKCRSTTAKGEP